MFAIAHDRESDFRHVLLQHESHEFRICPIVLDIQPVAHFIRPSVSTQANAPLAGSGGENIQCTKVDQLYTTFG